MKTEESTKSIYQEQNTLQNFVKEKKMDHACQLVQKSEVLIKTTNDKKSTKVFRKKCENKSKPKLNIKQLFKKEKVNKKMENVNRSKSFKLRTNQKETERINYEMRTPPRK